MLGRAMGQLVAGALWGVGAAVVMRIAREGGPENLGNNLQDITKEVVRNALELGERVEEIKQELVQSFESAVTEARAEREAHPTNNVEQ